MSLIEFVIKLIAEILLIAGIVFILIGCSCMDADMAFGIRMAVIGVAMAVPKLIIHFIDWLYADKKE